ncbi:MAG: MATE family efflux transporter [bacterium]|nr:MATE family efflux transporter [bacterium]
MSDNPKYYKPALISLITLSIPTILEEVLATLLQYVDTAMVGHLGEKATAAVSTTTSIGWLIHSISGAIAVAVLALASKANGAGDEDKLRKLAGQSIIYAFTIGILLEILALVLSPYIPIWMGVEEDIIKPASMYFTITSITLVFRTSARVFASMIRSIKDTKSPMVISVAENILNVILNYLLIYRFHLGVQGAAIASAISFGIGGIAMFALMLRKKKLRPTILDIKVDTEIFGEVLTIGLPALGATVVNCLGYVVFAGMVSGMGTTVFAAHSIAVAAEEIVYIPGYGLRAATSTLVGNSIGEGNYHKLKATERVSIAVTLLLMVINGTALFLFAYPFMKIFTPSVQVAMLGSKMLKLVSFSEPFFGLMIVLEGIAYGMGKTKPVFACESSSMWAVRILGTFICVKILGLGLTAVWICMVADNVCKAILLFIFRPRCEKLFVEESRR